MDACLSLGFLCPLCPALCGSHVGLRFTKIRLVYKCAAVTIFLLKKAQVYIHISVV